MQCPSCGTRLARGMLICPRCGTVLPYNTLPQEGESDEAPTSFGPFQESSSPLSDVDTSPTHAIANEMGYADSLHKSDTNYSFPAVSDTPATVVSSPTAIMPPASPAPLIIPAMEQTLPVSPVYTPYAPYTTPSAMPLPALSRQRQPLSRPMLLFSTAVALLLMLSGMSLIYYTAIAHPAQLRAQATATVQTILTTNARGTAMANAQATGTAQAFAHATATAQAQAQATVTALQALYTQATSGTPALSSTLAFQDGANWDAYNTPDGGGCNFSNGALHASVFTKNYYVPCLAHNSNFTNFAYQVQLTMVEGDEGGLMVRSDDTNNHFYIFSIARDGTYRFYVVKDSNNSLSLVDDTSSIIKTGAGQSNMLTVIAQGTTFYLYINQQYVASASDASFASGEVGVAASDTTNNTDVAFTNATVWTL